MHEIYKVYIEKLNQLYLFSGGIDLHYTIPISMSKLFHDVNNTKIIYSTFHINKTDSIQSVKLKILYTLEENSFLEYSNMYLHINELFILLTVNEKNTNLMKKSIGIEIQPESINAFDVDQSQSQSQSLLEISKNIDNHLLFNYLPIHENILYLFYVFFIHLHSFFQCA